MRRIFFVVLLATNTLNAQLLLPTGNYSNTAVPFLVIPPDCGKGGMGDAGVATSEDANAIHWNMANLAFAKREIGMSISYSPWLRSLTPEMHFGYISFYFKPDSISAFAASMRYIDYGSVTFSSSTGAIISQFRPNEYAIDAGYSRQLSERFSAGLTGRFFRSNFTNGITIAGQSTKPHIGFSSDISISYRSKQFGYSDHQHQPVTGLVVSNIGPKVDYSGADKMYLPTKIGIGQGIISTIGKHKLTTQLELSRFLVPLDARADSVSESEKILVSAGMEYVFAEIAKVRSGYFYQDAEAGNLQYMTFGLGLCLNIVQLDLAYLVPANNHRNPLGETLRFSLVFSFNKMKNNPRPHA